MKPIFYYQVDRKKGVVFLAVYFFVIFEILIAFVGIDALADVVNWFFANGIEALVILVVVLLIVPAVLIGRKIYGRCELQLNETEVFIRKTGEIIQTIELSKINSFEFIKLHNSLEMFDKTGESLHKFKLMDITGNDITEINNAFVRALPLELTKQEKKFLGTKYEIFNYRRKL